MSMHKPMSLIFFAFVMFWLPDEFKHGSGQRNNSEIQLEAHSSWWTFIFNEATQDLMIPVSTFSTGREYEVLATSRSTSLLINHAWATSWQEVTIVEQSNVSLVVKTPALWGCRPVFDSPTLSGYWYRALVCVWLLIGSYWCVTKSTTTTTTPSYISATKSSCNHIRSMARGAPSGRYRTCHRSFW